MGHAYGARGLCAPARGEKGDSRAEEQTLYVQT